jgi:hypothetical protein
MKKVKMVITLAVVLAIVGSAFTFNANKGAKFCVTTSGGSGNCYIITSKRTTVGVTLRYEPNWDGVVCNGSSPCSTLGTFTLD